MNHVKVAVAQVGATQNLEINTAKVLDVLEEAGSEAVDLVVLPECVLSGYMYESRFAALDQAVDLEGPEIHEIATACARLRLHAVIGLLERDASGGLFNSAVLIDDTGAVRGSYRKTHLPTLGVDRYVDAGTEPPPVFATRCGNIGLAICYDLRFPETARILALAGADIIAQPSTWPHEAVMLADHFVAVRACENRVFVAVANRPDAEAGVEFMGRSQIAAPDGSRLVEADVNGRRILCALLDIEQARDKRIVNVPGEYEVSLFADRRPELYGQIASS